MPVAAHITRLARHSAIYGAGDLVARFLGVLLLPLYTAYLSPADYGKIEILVAASAIVLVVLRRGVADGFYRFYFNSPDAVYRTRLIQTTFWFTMVTATVALVLGLAFAAPLAHVLQLGDEPDLVRAAAVGLWAQLNYTQLSSVLRAEERSVESVAATLINVLVTIVVTVLLVVVYEHGPARSADRELRRHAHRVCPTARAATTRPRAGIQEVAAARPQPLRHAVGACSASTLGDQLRRPLVHRSPRRPGRGRRVLRSSTSRRGRPPPAPRVPPRLAAARVLDRGRRGGPTDVCVRAHVRRLRDMLGGGRVYAPRAVDRPPPTSETSFLRAADAVGPLAFAAVAYAGYGVVSIAAGRAWRTGGNWIVAGAAAALNVALCFALIPAHGMMGAAVATVFAYCALFAGMLLYAERVYPIGYQWRRIVTLVSLGVALAILSRSTSLPFAVAVALAGVFPRRARPARLLPSRRDSAHPPPPVPALAGRGEARGRGGLAVSGEERAHAAGGSDTITRSPDATARAASVCMRNWSPPQRSRGLRCLRGRPACGRRPASGSAPAPVRRPTRDRSARRGPQHD